MKRRYILGASALLITAVAGATIVRCDFSSLAYTSYSFIPREQPRVFVSHRPIRAVPDQTIEIRIEPDLRPGDGAPLSAKARIKRGSNNAFEDVECTDAGGGTFSCPVRLDAGDKDYVYDGSVTLASRRVQSRTSYRFRAATTLTANDVITLREPVKPLARLADNYRVTTVFVRDDGDGYSEDAFLVDVDAAVYDGILADPVYRWRDAHLAFYAYGAAGETTSYYSGFNTRCGQNPWPADGIYQAVAGMNVIGVLHRHPNTAGGVEGTVTSTDVFRDCAGRVKDTDITTFSATGGQVKIARHEFGHAAFSLGDEYTESDATRRAPAANPFSNAQCCCMRETGVGTGGGVIPGGATPGGAGGTGVDSTGASAGGVRLEPRLALPVCAGGRTATNGLGLSACPADLRDLPSECYAEPEEACPLLSLECVNAESWLGRQPPAGGIGTTRNSFTSKADCDAARAAVLIHPGIEDRDQSVETACRQVCGGDLAACPCNQGEAWIIDKSPTASSMPATSSSDAMGTLLADRHGATCAWCVESTLCVRWQLSIGQTAEQAWSFCQAPPLEANANERSWNTFAAALVAAIVEATRGWLF
jgi:hypothetical protein